MSTAQLVEDTQVSGDIKAEQKLSYVPCGPNISNIFRAL